MQGAISRVNRLAFPKGTIRKMANFVGMESRTLNPGSQCPPLPQDRLRFYNMRFCPYAERTLLVLAVKGIPTETVNVNLKYKPDWFVARNPLGKVPTIEHAGQIIYESAVCNEYLDEAFPNTKQILPKDPVARAHQKMLAELLSKLSSSTHGTIRGPQEEERLEKVVKALDLCENLLKDSFYGGADAGWADYMAWPWFERLGAVELASGGKFKVTAEKWPKVCAYVERMNGRPEVQACRRDAKYHMGFFQSFISEGGPNYDLGLQSSSL